jgi:hypothetical protein
MPTEAGDLATIATQTPRPAMGLESALPSAETNGPETAGEQPSTAAPENTEVKPEGVELKEGSKPSEKKPAEKAKKAKQGAGAGDRIAKRPLVPAQGALVMFCPYHPQCRLQSKNSTDLFTRYYCPEKTCKYVWRQPRNNIRQIARQMAERDELQVDPRA